jgi:hypothetical protein
MVGSCVDEPYLDLVRLFHIDDVAFIVIPSFVAPYLSDKQLIGSNVRYIFIFIHLFMVWQDFSQLFMVQIEFHSAQMDNLNATNK